MYRTEKKTGIKRVDKDQILGHRKNNKADVALALCSSEQRGEQTKSADCGIELALQWWEVNVVNTAPMLAIITAPMLAIIKQCYYKTVLTTKISNPKCHSQTFRAHGGINNTTVIKTFDFNEVVFSVHF